MHGEIEQNWRVQEYFDNNKAKGRPALHEVTTRVKRGRVRNTALYSFSPRMAMRTDIVIVFWELGTAVFLIRIWDWKFTINTKLDGALLMLFVNYSFFFLFFQNLLPLRPRSCAPWSPRATPTTPPCPPPHHTASHYYLITKQLGRPDCSQIEIPHLSKRRKKEGPSGFGRRQR
jgi:hypothetical protein